MALGAQRSMPLDTHSALPPCRIGGTLRHARTAAGRSRDQLARECGISLRTLVKIEQGDDSVAFGSYRKVASQLELEWLFTLFAGKSAPGAGPIPEYYLSGATALALPGADGTPPVLWYSSSISNPNTWRIAGKTLTNTTYLLGVIGLRDATDIIAQYGVHLPCIWAASPERAVFDLLIHFCEVKGQAIPNIQAGDVDDVVDIERVQDWIAKCEPFLSASGRMRIQNWINGTDRCS